MANVDKRVGGGKNSSIVDKREAKALKVEIKRPRGGEHGCERTGQAEDSKLDHTCDHGFHWSNIKVKVLLERGEEYNRSQERRRVFEPHPGSGPGHWGEALDSNQIEMKVAAFHSHVCSRWFITDTQMWSNAGPPAAGAC